MVGKKKKKNEDSSYPLFSMNLSNSGKRDINQIIIVMSL